MTIGTLRNEEEVTLFSPEVAQKLLSALVGFLGTYLLPWQGWGHPSKQHRLHVSWLSLSRGIITTTTSNWKCKARWFPGVFRGRPYSVLLYDSN